MNFKIIATLGLAALTTIGASAQSAIDAYNITPSQLRGTARFVSMGGAFTSLGSDLSCLTQNPAGLGLYRYNDIGISFDVSFRNYKAASNYQSGSISETKADFDNFGYVGVTNLSGTLTSFQWGVSYNRLTSFDRRSSGMINPTNTSLSNYIASYTNGVHSDDLLDSSDFNPYYDSSSDWLSALAYNSFMINNTNNEESYAGLYQNGTAGDVAFDNREQGYIDEYNIDFAGNVQDVVYWGIGVGIMDVNYNSETYYSESMAGALVYDQSRDILTTGNAGFELYNRRTITGSGANIKLGIIVRPIDAIRIGLAVHTPTWLHLTHTGFGDVDYAYTPDNSNSSRPTNSGYTGTPEYNYLSRLNTPWRIMVGASAVIGSKAIISADYERVAYGDMSMKEQGSGYFGGYVENKYANQDIKNYFKAANIYRVGVEYRLSRSVSVRAGYNYQSTAISDAAKSPSTTVYTSGTDASYTFFDDATQNVSLGLGYHYKSWYVDAAWQYTQRKGTYHAYTSFDGNIAPSASITDTNNNIVISTGFRF